jgi:hypothetical protein
MPQCGKLRDKEGEFTEREKTKKGNEGKRREGGEECV